MDEDCPICLEKLSKSYCSKEICFTCKNFFCKKCLYPENFKRIDTCPCCRTSLGVLDKDIIEKCSKIIEEKDYPHIGYIFFILGSTYYRMGDGEKSLEYLKKAADKKVSCAYNFLEDYYNEGKFVEKNILISNRYFELALENHCSAALYKQAIIEFVFSNLDRGMSLMKEAAELGLPKAEYSLANYGLLYNNLSREKCLVLLNNSFKKGYIKAGLDLGSIYYYGFYDVPVDKHKAIEYYLGSVELGSIEAALYLGKHYFDLEDYYTASKWYKFCLDEGDNIASVMLSKCFLNMAEDLGFFMVDEAVKILKSAIEKNYAPAYFELGNLYFSGHRFYLPDYKNAFKYMKKASDLKYYPAYYMLSVFYKLGVGTDIDEELSKDFYRLYDINHVD